MDTINHH